MTLKQLNLGSAQMVPKDWIPETRFINYEYGPLCVQTPSLPQEPSKASQEQPLKGATLK
jgi:hypothetical protein